MVTVLCYAKINLVLDILGKRPDGYHELRTIMQSISLADKLIIKKTAVPGIQLETNKSVTSLVSENIVYKAADLIRQKHPQVTGVKITLEKQIPVAAGLAGGSADCAGALLGIDALFELGMSAAELEEIANKLGSDIAFCLQGGIKLAQGRGELISTVPSLPVTQGLILKPPFPLSTADIYRAIPTNFSNHKTQNYVDCYQRGSVDMRNIGSFISNDLYPFALQKRAELKSFIDTVKKTGPIACQMSGSGPTIFALYDSIVQRNEALTQLAPYEVYPFYTVSKGCELSF